MSYGTQISTGPERKYTGSSNSKCGPENQDREGERNVAGLSKLPQLDLVPTGCFVKRGTHGSQLPGHPGIPSSSHCWPLWEALPLAEEPTSWCCSLSNDNKGTSVCLWGSGAGGSSEGGCPQSSRSCVFANRGAELCRGAESTNCL